MRQLEVKGFWDPEVTATQVRRNEFTRYVAVVWNMQEFMAAQASPEIMFVFEHDEKIVGKHEGFTITEILGDYMFLTEEDKR